MPLLDAALLDEIAAGFLAAGPTPPSDRLLAALAEAGGTTPAALRARFEARSRAGGAESALAHDMPFSGSG